MVLLDEPSNDLDVEILRDLDSARLQFANWSRKGSEAIKFKELT